MDTKTIEVSTISGDTISVTLTPDEERAHSCLIIDGVTHHFERVKRDDLLLHYKVDSDPDYMPKTDTASYCYVLAPYSE